MTTLVIIWLLLLYVSTFAGYGEAGQGAVRRAAADKRPRSSTSKGYIVTYMDSFTT